MAGYEVVHMLKRLEQGPIQSSTLTEKELLIAEFLEGERMVTIAKYPTTDSGDLFGHISITSIGVRHLRESAAD